MATAHEESAGRSLEGLSSRQGCDSGEALTEWRSCEQVENGTPSTSPPYWDTDDSDDDGGLKPCDLYGKYTWKIEKFSTINKRELKSSVFEVGGYRWYILIYPQGCDVCNHLSLFLCVANHDKLLPGWSHFAQFTIAVVNKDPKKSKYSDTLHRFWKKEHDWGWKKFMELSKVSDGFLDADTLIIKAQVQVVRERSNRPFRCLDCQYRRELVRVYLTNVEQICRRFVDDRRGKLETLLEDKARWSSFCAFWLEIDQSARRLMSSEKMDSILKMIVKHFFIEKDVTSTLVIDSLYSGFKALKGQSKCIIGKAKVLEGVDMPPPVVQVEEEMFVLVDDVLLLLERATTEPLPPKDEKGPQNRTKDGGAGEDFSKDSIERDERRLTELGRRTVEIFVLTHIFSKIEAAYQEAIALKRQEELIREEKAESEQRAKREMAGKEKRLLKKKQSKQKRNNRKAKDKLKDEKPGLMSEDNHIHRIPAEEVKDSLGGPTILDKDETLEDVSDVSDSVEYSADILQPDSEDRDSSPVNWDTDISEVLPPEASSSAVGGDISSLHIEGDTRSSSVMDDSSSTCSTDSAPSLVTNVSYRRNSSKKNKSQKLPTRGKNQRASVTYEEANGSKEANRLTSKPVKDLRHQQHTFADKVAVSSEYEAADSSLEETMKQPEQLIVKKEEEVIVLQKKQSNINQVASDRQKKEKASAASYLPQSPPKRMISTFHPKSEPKDIPVDVIPASKIGANSMQYTNKAASSVNVPQASSTAKLGSTTAPLPKPTEKRSGQQATFLISRPLSTPLIPGSKPAVTPIVPVAQTVPVLSRSMSATGRLGPDPSSAKRSYSALSYKSAILGNVAVSPSSFSQPPPSPSSAVNMSPSPVPSPSPSLSFSKSSTLVPGPIYIPQATERVMLKSVNPGISYSAAAREAVLHSGRHQWLDSPRREAPNRSIPFDPPSMLDEIQNLELNNSPIHTRSHDVLQSNFSISTSGRQATQVADEFPHLDIINDLLDDEQGFGSGLTLPDQRFSLPTDLSVPVGLGSSPGSCRVEQMYYEDFFQPEYGLPGNDYDTLPEYIPYNNMPYMNGQIDGSVHNQWPVAGYDHLSMLNMGNAGTGDWYAYGVPEYSDLACGLNGYTMFRPSNGQ